jgi:hypothetical protein
MSPRGSHRATPPCVSEGEEEEPPCMSEEEEETHAGVEEEEPPSTSRLSHPMKPLPGARKDERCGGGWSFPPRGAREEERCSSRENKPPVTVSGMPLRELQMIGNHR